MAEWLCGDHRFFFAIVIAKSDCVGQIGLMHFVACSVSARCRQLVLAIAAVLSSTSGNASQAASSCNATVLPGKVHERSGTDTYKSPSIQGGDRLTVFSFPRRLDPLRGRAIVDEDPLNAVARLSDGSGLSFDRDCRGERCIYLGIKVTPRAVDCWEWMSDENTARDTSGRFTLGGDSFISADNSRLGGRLMLHTVTGNWEAWISEPLIVGMRPIVGFGVSVPAIHQPLRTIDVIRREKDGSLSLATYVYKYR